METISSSKTLFDVNLQSVNLSEGPAKLLSSAVCRLQTQTKLTNNQCVKILKAIIFSKTLVKVDLMSNNLTCPSVGGDPISIESILKTRWTRMGYVNLSGVPADLLATAVSRLQMVNLLDTKLIPDQCVTVVEAIYSSKTLVDVDLGCVNLGGVPTELLARAVTRLQAVKL